MSAILLKLPDKLMLLLLFQISFLWHGYFTCTKAAFILGECSRRFWMLGGYGTIAVEMITLTQLGFTTNRWFCYPCVNCCSTIKCERKGDQRCSNFCMCSWVSSILKGTTMHWWLYSTWHCGRLNQTKCTADCCIGTHRKRTDVEHREKDDPHST